MLFPTFLSPSYIPLADTRSETSPQPIPHPKATARTLHIHLFSCCAISLILGLALGGLLSTRKHYPSHQLKAVSSSSSPACQQPVIRREWRSLSRVEKMEYLSTVKCLTQLPPATDTVNGSAHDEFAWVHSIIGGYCE